MLRRLFFLPSDRDAAFDIIDTQLSFNTLLGGFIYAAAVEFGDEDVRSFRTYSSTWDPILLTQNLWASSALCIIGCKIGLVLNLALHSSLSAQPTTVRTRCYWPIVRGFHCCSPCQAAHKETRRAWVNASNAIAL